MRPNSASARLTGGRLLSRTSSGFGDLREDKRGVNLPSYEHRQLSHFLLLIGGETASIGL